MWSVSYLCAYRDFEESQVYCSWNKIKIRIHFFGVITYFSHYYIISNEENRFLLKQIFVSLWNKGLTLRKKVWLCSFIKILLMKFLKWDAAASCDKNLLKNVDLFRPDEPVSLSSLRFYQWQIFIIIIKLNKHFKRDDLTWLVLIIN